MKKITVSAAIAEMHRQAALPPTTLSKEHVFGFDVAEINVFLAAEGKMLKLEGGAREVDPRWTLLMGTPPSPGSSELVFSYVLTDLTQRETKLYLVSFLSGMKEERNIADATLQKAVDKFTALLKKGN